VEIGELAENFDHAPIIFQSVEPRPRQYVASCFRVAVLRLMHVPQDNQMDPLH